MAVFRAAVNTLMAGMCTPSHGWGRLVTEPGSPASGRKAVPGPGRASKLLTTCPTASWPPQGWVVTPQPGTRPPHTKPPVTSGHFPRRPHVQGHVSENTDHFILKTKKKVSGQLKRETTRYDGCSSLNSETTFAQWKAFLCHPNTANMGAISSNILHFENTNEV